MDRRIRVIVADDDPLIRGLLKKRVEDEADLEWVGEAGSAAEMIELCAHVVPDVAIIDVRMPGGGPTAVAGVLEHCPDVRIVAMSGDGRLSARRSMFDAGVVTYMVKGQPLDEVLRTVREVATSAA